MITRLTRKIIVIFFAFVFTAVLPCLLKDHKILFFHYTLTSPPILLLLICDLTLISPKVSLFRMPQAKLSFSFH